MGGKEVSFSGKAPRLSHRRWQPPSQARLAVTTSFNDTSQDLSGKQTAFSPRQKQLKLPASRQKGPSCGCRALREVRPGAAPVGLPRRGRHSRVRGREEDRPPPVPETGRHTQEHGGRREKTRAPRTAAAGPSASGVPPRTARRLPSSGRPPGKRRAAPSASPGGETRARLPSSLDRPCRAKPRRGQPLRSPSPSLFSPLSPLPPAGGRGRRSGPGGEGAAGAGSAGSASFAAARPRGCAVRAPPHLLDGRHRVPALGHPGGEVGGSR